MAVLPDLLKKVKTFFASVAGFFRGLRTFDLKEKLNLPELLRNFGDFLRERIQMPILPQKRLLVLVCAAGGLILAVSIGVLLGRNSGKEIRSTEPDNISRRFAIPPEELFLPDEPDFVPGVLLERERRTSWTVQDAAVYWHDPLKNGEEQWRETIEAAIDKFLERVP